MAWRWFKVSERSFICSAVRRGVLSHLWAEVVFHSFFLQDDEVVVQGEPVTFWSDHCRYAYLLIAILLGELYSPAPYRYSSMGGWSERCARALVSGSLHMSQIPPRVQPRSFPWAKLSSPWRVWRSWIITTSSPRVCRCACAACWLYTAWSSFGKSSEKGSRISLPFWALIKKKHQRKWHGYGHQIK
jgi:hypothetical protein